MQTIDRATLQAMLTKTQEELRISKKHVEVRTLVSISRPLGLQPALLPSALRARLSC